PTPALPLKGRESSQTFDLHPSPRGAKKSGDLGRRFSISLTERLVQHDRVARRTGRPDDAQGRPDKRTFLDAGRNQRLGIDVFQVPDAAAGLHLGVARHRKAVLLTTWLSVVGRSVAHLQSDVL